MASEAQAPQLTFRAALTGIGLGAVLAVCNLYLSLKLALSVNMAVTAAVLALALWRVVVPLARLAPFALLENNAAQTVASAAAFISSAGLSAAVPALMIITGEVIPFWALSLWLFAVCLVGILLAVPLRQLYVDGERLPFATGVATATVLQQLHADAARAAVQVRLLVGGAVAGAGAALAEAIWTIPKLALPGGLAVRAGGALERAGVAALSWHNLTVSLPPTFLFFAVGALVGPRIAWSLLLGAFVAWGVIAPALLELGLVNPGPAAAMWFSPLAGFLVWPGAALMVSAALTSLICSAASALSRRRRAATPLRLPRGFWLGLGGTLLLVVGLQLALFDVRAPVAIMAVLLSLPLAVVAARVSGETAVTPAAPVGKVSQLLVGLVEPAATTNLVAGNVAAGAASQCADLLDDLKAGQLLGASPIQLTCAQILGAATGALAGAATFLLLFPSPRQQLLSAEWPAPAAATWKVVAEALARGLDGLPPGALETMVIAGAAGVALVAFERLGPARFRPYSPSPTSVGLAFVVPAYVAIAAAVGAATVIAWRRLQPAQAEGSVPPLAAGLIAGESLAGVALALWRLTAG